MRAFLFQPMWCIKIGFGHGAWIAIVLKGGSRIRMGGKRRETLERREKREESREEKRRWEALGLVGPLSGMNAAFGNGLLTHPEQRA